MRTMLGDESKPPADRPKAMGPGAETHAKTGRHPAERSRLLDEPTGGAACTRDFWFADAYSIDFDRVAVILAVAGIVVPIALSGVSAPWM
jgi:hypothetical protein